MIRTRAIIQKLSYDDLVKRGIIPDLFSFIEQSETTVAIKRYPPFVYCNKEGSKFSFFGVLMDYIIRAGLRINLKQKVEIETDPITNIIQTSPDENIPNIVESLTNYETSNNINDIIRDALVLTSTLFGKSIYSHEEIQKYIPCLVNIIKDIVAKWNSYGVYLDGIIRFNTEYSYGTFSGHPDIVVNKCVLDVKTTGSFRKMAKESCLQVLAYYALMKPTTPTLQYVGFLFPLQRDIAIYDVSNWDASEYLHILSIEADKLAVFHNDAVILYVDDMNMLIEQLTAMGFNIPHEINHTPINNYKIGHHIRKGRNIATSLRNYVSNQSNYPCQMFLANPRTGKRNANTAKQLDGAAQIIKETGLQYFTHAAYVINLCANECDNGDYWQQRYLNEDLAFTVAMGGKGVVVHTGARKHLSEKDSLQIMEYMVRTALSYATEECPLLLETPSGEGTEVVTKIEELGQFFYRFSADEKKKLGICVDTCHIFSANYDPLQYLQHWEKYCPVPIKLVHFNDSRESAGSHKDRHAFPGTGYIGIEKMTAIAAWCHERLIPMIIE